MPNSTVAEFEPLGRGNGRVASINESRGFKKMVYAVT